MPTKPFYAIKLHFTIKYTKVIKCTLKQQKDGKKRLNFEV